MMETINDLEKKIKKLESRLLKSTDSMKIIHTKIIKFAEEVK